MGTNRVPGTVTTAVETTRVCLSRIKRPFDLSGIWQYFDWSTHAVQEGASTTLDIRVASINSVVESVCQIYKQTPTFDFANCHISLKGQEEGRWTFRCYRPRGVIVVIGNADPEQLKKGPADWYGSSGKLGTCSLCGHNDYRIYQGYTGMQALSSIHRCSECKWIPLGSTARIA